MAATETVDVSVVLPCLNEEQSVGLCVDEALTALRGSGLTGEVIVADNGSKDRSVEMASAAGALVVHESEPGYGAAIAAGIRAAAGSVIVMADADHTYPLDRIGELVAPVRAGDADLVLGSRLAAASNDTMPVLHRFVGTPVLSFLNRRAAPNLSVVDSQSGFRAFRRREVVELGLASTGMEFASEMLIKAAQAGWRIQERPTGYRPRIGESKLHTFADGWRHLRLILLSAPDLLLVWPGVTLIVLGLVCTLFGLVTPEGMALGSITWQPVFFSTILLVVGTNAVLSGAVTAYRSSVVSSQCQQRFAFVGTRRFSSMCSAGGVVALVVGLALDVALFIAWSNGTKTIERGYSSAALAQSLIIVGATTITVGVILRFTSGAVRQSRPAIDLEAETPLAEPSAL